MKRLVCWALLILVVGCHRGGEPAETKLGEVKSQEGSTAAQSAQSAQSVQPAPPAEVSAQTAAEPALQLGQTTEQSSPAAAKAPTTAIGKALDKKEVQDISFESQMSLKGIKSLGVVVWGFMDPEAEKAGLTHEVLMSTVKAKLEKSGIQVQKQGEANEDPGHAVMYVKLDIRKRQNFPVFLGYIDVSLFQFVYLGRNPKLVLLSETWSTHSQPFLYAEESLLQYSREQLQGELDSFIKDFAKYNTGVKAPSAAATKTKPAASVETAPSSQPSEAVKKPAPASAPKPAPGGAEKAAGKKP